jgi:hypothetical protein
LVAGRFGPYSIAGFLYILNHEDGQARIISFRKLSLSLNAFIEQGLRLLFILAAPRQQMNVPKEQER